MPYKYDEVVPWGRSMEEYIWMFNLTPENLKLKILGCGDGPASFNYEMTKLGYQVTSIDPLYQFTAKQIQERIKETYDNVIGQTYQNQEKFIWERISSVEALGELRMSSMKKFLSDFKKGKKEGRYIEAKLPHLSFQDEEFDLGLSSHLLFFYTDILTYDFHLRAISEMCRVAKEVRIFPLLNVNNVFSPYVGKIIDDLYQLGKKAKIEKVPYEFQKGGNQMLKIQ
ncbi:MAG: SAM-dependent methyltransferase [Candidatus Lokiarchaeota archaeon]|nr:SAM-dependent methyltransferase [Candidatus Lokiarchaeota archaeon]